MVNRVRCGKNFVGLCFVATLAFSHCAWPQRALPVEELKAFSAAFDLIKKDYVGEVDDKKLFADAIRGMVSGLDAHSVYLDRDELRDAQAGMQGQYGGVGIEMSVEEGGIKVIAPIDDTPAARAGIQAGDMIVKLDDTAVKGMTLSEAIKRMRGKPSTELTLTLERKGQDLPFTLTLTRAVIRTQSVKSQLVEPDYAYLRVTRFQEHTGEMLADAIKTLYEQNSAPLKGLVLDLRNDPGGLLYSAVAVSAAFLPRDSLVVYTEGRSGSAKFRLIASPRDYLPSNSKRDYLAALPAETKSVPMVVLVNSGSASASEIVAGALQDYKRAVVMGTQTFGKASVQNIFPIDNDTAVKFTTARYFTPKGRSIQLTGITPDIALDDGTTSDTKVRLREANLSNHLSKIAAVEPALMTAASTETSLRFVPAPRVKQPEEKKVPLEPGQVISDNDYELTQAIAFLKSLMAPSTIASVHKDNTQ
jgi:carboxyl-terminal processing protease